MNHSRMLLPTLLSIILVVLLILPASTTALSTALDMPDQSVLDDSVPASVTPQITTAEIEGQIREVNCETLEGVIVELYRDDEVVDDTTTDWDGLYDFTVYDTDGSYEVVANKWGFREQRQSVEVEMEEQYTLDFSRDHGLIPNAPSASYAMDCVNMWLFPPDPEGGLSAARAMDVVNAWLYPQEDEIVYYEHTKDVTEEEADNVTELTEDRERLLFDTATGFVAGIEPGDVLMCEHPVPGAEHGFLKRVTGVSSTGLSGEGGEVEVTVEPATLEDAIDQGMIVVTETIPIQDLLSSAVWAEGVEVSQVEGGREFRYEPAEGVTIEGYLLVTADADIHIKTNFWGRLTEFEFVFSPGLEMEATLTVEQDVSWDREYNLVTITGPPIPVYGPVTITPEIELVVGTEGEITATLEASVTYDRGYDVGIRYYDGSWSTITGIRGDGATLHPPTFSGQAEARVFGGAVLSGTAGVSHVAEATIGTRLLGNVRASGEIETSPWQWQYDLELYISAQVFAELELLRIAGAGWESPTWEYPDPPYNLAYGASGRVTEDGEGLEGVAINFSDDHSSATTDDNGYWSKHLLSGNVEVTPEKDGYVFDPPSIAITGSRSDLDFLAFDKLDLIVTSSEGGSVIVTVDGAGTVVGPGETETMSDIPVGTEVGLEASPDSDYEFAEWQGEPIDGVTDPSTTITMNGRYSITATFHEVKDVVEIWDWHDLHSIRNDRSGDYVLMNDLDATTAGYAELAGPAADGRRGWIPIGSGGGPSDWMFTGSFDGQGYEIRDLHISRSTAFYVGLFGAVGRDGLIRNVGVVNTHVRGRGSVGGLVGYNAGTMSNSYSTGIVTGSRLYRDVGGLVGRSTGTVGNSYSTSSVTGHENVGGLVGRSSGTVDDSYSTGSVTGEDYVGGLVGYHIYAMVSNCYSTGNVMGSRWVGGLVGLNSFATVGDSHAGGDVTGDISVGGLVGGSDYSTVSNSHATGSVTGDNRVGGLVGWNRGTVSNSYAFGSVTGSVDVGGLVGYNAPDGVLSNCFSTGTVIGNDIVGGLVGYNGYGVVGWGTVRDCYSTGTVVRLSGSEGTSFGGFVGTNRRGKVIRCYATGSVHYEGVEDPTDKGFAGSVDTGGNYEMIGNFWDTETSGQSSTEGKATSKSTTEMLQSTTFTNAQWCFAERWGILEGVTYPFLQWQQPDTYPYPP